MKMTDADPLVPFRAEVIVEDSMRVMTAEFHRFQGELRQLTEEFRQLHFPVESLLDQMVNWFQLRSENLIKVAEAHLDQVPSRSRHTLEVQLQTVKASIPQELKLLLEILETGAGDPKSGGAGSTGARFAAAGGATC